MVTIFSLVILVDVLCGPEHNNLVAEWCQCLRDLKLHLKKEPKNEYIDREDRPDIIVYDLGIDANAELDFSLAHPFCRDTVVRALRENRFAAAKREETKINKYLNQQHPRSCKAAFIPLIFEHFGCWGEKADNYLNQLAKRSRYIESGSNEAQFRGQWRKRLSICLQKFNSNVILRKLKKNCRGK